MTFSGLLEDGTQWQRAADGDRLEVANALATRFGGFDVTKDSFGGTELIELVHRHSGIAFVIIPGGSFLMGLRAGELEQIRDAAMVDTLNPSLEAFITKSTPVRRVEVSPFLCARAPILDIQMSTIDPNLLGRCPLDGEEDFPDLDEPFEPDEDESDLMLDEKIDAQIDERRSLRPAFLSADEAVRVSREIGFRLLQASEWEYVARDLGRQCWIAARGGSPSDIERSVSELSYRPFYLPGDGRDLASNELGVWGLHLGEWVREGRASRPGLDEDTGGRRRRWFGRIKAYFGADAAADDSETIASRGGAVLSWPWQDSDEILLAHPALRLPGGAFYDISALRLAMDIPTYRSSGATEL